MTAVMPSYSAPASGPPVDTGDRLSFTVFLALALHALLIFGISFTLDRGGNQSPTLEITLATHKSSVAPNKADYLAQFDQEASGTEDDARQLTTDQSAEFADTVIRDINPTPQTRAVTPSEQKDLQQVTTTGDSPQKARLQIDPNPSDEVELQEGSLEDLPLLSAEITSLRAKLDQQRQEYAKRPRIRRLTSVATKTSLEAEYLHRWSSKVEFIGNRNYPEEALKESLFGTLRLAAVIKANGTVDRVEILQSSGHPMLDQAALQIVHLASPFMAFPADISKEYDQLEIIRTWHFEITGLSTSS